MRHALVTEVWPPEIGGSAQLFDSLYGRNFPPGDAVHVIAGGGRRHDELDASYPMPVTRFSSERVPWMKPESARLYADMLATTMRVCLRERVEVLHCGRVIPEGLVGLAVSRALGIPYTVWVHGEEVSIFMRYAVKKRLMPEVFRHARAVFANSSFTLGRATLAGAPHDKVHVVNPAVDAARFAGPHDGAAVRARWGVEGRTVLLTVGRLTRRKGHDKVLDALVSLRATHPDLAWLVLSVGELEDELKARCAELGLDGVVRWVGPVKPHELPGYYAAADLFVHPNRTLDDDDVEGFGMVFLEASASGVPVIGGRSGGVPDAVQDRVTGLLVDGERWESVADAIASLASDPERRAAMGEAGRQWAKGFSWRRQAAKVRALSEGAAEAPPEHAAP